MHWEGDLSMQHLSLHSPFARLHGTMNGAEMSATGRKQNMGLLIAAAVGIGVWVLYWLVSRFTAIEVSSFWWWFGFPLMLVASWLLGDRFRHKAWRLGVVMMMANMMIAFAFVPGAGNLLPFAIIIYTVMAIPCALLAHWAAKDAAKPDTPATP